MKYLLLIYGNEKTWAAADPAPIHAAHAAYARMLTERGALVSGEELAPTATATTVRTDGGGFLLTDGPYAETNEQIGGYYIVEAADIDEAIAYAKALPEDIVEVRPIVDNNPA